MTDICPICRDDISGFNTCTLPECNHTFHADCLVSWFRSPRDWCATDKTGYGTCPLCRATPFGDGPSWCTVNGRVALITQLSRKKNGLHPKIQKMILKLKEAKKKEKEAAEEIKLFRKKYKEYFDKWDKLRKNRWRSNRRIYRLREKISEFDPIFLLNYQNFKV